MAPGVDVVEGENPVPAEAPRNPDAALGEQQPEHLVEFGQLHLKPDTSINIQENDERVDEGFDDLARRQVGQIF